MHGCTGGVAPISDLGGTYNTRLQSIFNYYAIVAFVVALKEKKETSPKPKPVCLLTMRCCSGLGTLSDMSYSFRLLAGVQRKTIQHVGGGGGGGGVITLRFVNR